MEPSENRETIQALPQEPRALTAIYLAKRNPRLERGEFPRRWRSHGELALSLPFMDPCIGYFHDDVLADPPRDADPYTANLWSADPDGVGIVMFASPTDVEALFNHPDFPTLLADEWGAFYKQVEDFVVLTQESIYKARLGTAIRLFIFLRPRAGVDGDTFASRWLRHVGLVMSSPELAELAMHYVHYTPLTPADTGDGDETVREWLDQGLTDVAGVASVGFASRADMEAYLGHPDRAAVGADLAEFADLDASLMLATNEVTMKATRRLR
jgi:hypothetical protein